VEGQTGIQTSDMKEDRFEGKRRWAGKECKGVSDSRNYISYFLYAYL
jgi:hypothetical protein